MGSRSRLGGAQQRALLAVLLIHRGEVLSTDRLIDELWAGAAPSTAAKTVAGLRLAAAQGARRRGDRDARDTATCSPSTAIRSTSRASRR